jgi:hypothetical protein
VLLESRLVIAQSGERDLATLVVPRIGCVVAATDPLEPYRLLDADGAAVTPVASFLRELLAASRAPADVAFVCDGLAALVAVSRGGGCPLGAGDPG